MVADPRRSRSGGPRGDGSQSPGAIEHPPESSAAEDTGLPISLAAARTGISADTLRVWQRRYGLGASRQSAGGHRRYTRGDLERLREVQRLVEHGASVGEAARSVLRESALDLPLPVGSIPRAHRLAAAAADLDGPAVRTLLRDHIVAHGVVATWETLLRPVLAAIGERWSRLPHGIAMEHLVSRAADLTLCEIMSERRSTDRGAPSVLLACVPEEQHELPMVALGAAIAEHGIIPALLPSRPTIAEITDEAIRYSTVTVLYDHISDRRWLSVPHIWPPQAALLVAGPGWDPGRLPATVGHTNDLADAVRRVVDRAASR